MPLQPDFIDREKKFYTLLPELWQKTVVTSAIF